MGKKWLLAALLCWIGLSSCSNPVKGNGPIAPGIVLSAKERADIALLAGNFSKRQIIRISVDSTKYIGWYYPHTVNENDFTGTVQFDSVYADTDKISYQTLLFYNRNWYKFTVNGLPDSEKVFINNWYSSPAWFNTLEKMVFKINSLTIIAAFSGDLNKAQVSEFLNKIAAIQPGLLDTNQQHDMVGFSMPEVSSIGSSANHDTTYIDLQCGGNWMSTYRFKFIADEFREVSIMTVVF